MRIEADEDRARQNPQRRESRMLCPPSAPVVPRPRSNRLCSRHEDEETDSTTAAGLAMVEKENSVGKGETPREWIGPQRNARRWWWIRRKVCDAERWCYSAEGIFRYAYSWSRRSGISRLMEASVWLPC